MDEKELKEIFLKYLKEFKGIVSDVCKKMNIDRVNYIAWLKDPDFKEVCDEITQETNDWVEAQLLKSIQVGNVAAIQFYCRTKLRDRGYSDKIDPEEVSDKQVTVFLNDEMIGNNEKV